MVGKTARQSSVEIEAKQQFCSRTDRILVFSLEPAPAASFCFPRNFSLVGKPSVFKMEDRTFAFDRKGMEVSQSEEMCPVIPINLAVVSRLSLGSQDVVSCRFAVFLSREFKASVLLALVQIGLSSIRDVTELLPLLPLSLLLTSDAFEAVKGGRGTSPPKELSIFLSGIPPQGLGAHIQGGRKKKNPKHGFAGKKPPH